MKIIKARISPAYELLGKIERVEYENSSSYLVLTISEWLKNLKLDLGKFNWVVFEEEELGDSDFTINNNNLYIGVRKEFNLGADTLSNPDLVHDYFIKKFIEGFKRFDEHFKLEIAPELEKYLEDYFSSGYCYEKQKVSKRIGKHKYQVIYQYFYNTFNLVLRVVDKAGDVAIEQILESDKPDLILNSYNYYKVTIADNKICVYGNSGKVRKSFSIEPFYIH